MAVDDRAMRYTAIHLRVASYDLAIAGATNSATGSHSARWVCLSIEAAVFAFVDTEFHWFIWDCYILLYVFAKGMDKRLFSRFARDE